jgi:hypothetical protein
MSKKNRPLPLKVALAIEARRERQRLEAERLARAFPTSWQRFQEAVHSSDRRRVPVAHWAERHDRNRPPGRSGGPEGER